MYMTITDWRTEMPARPEQFAADVGVAFENFKEIGATNFSSNHSIINETGFGNIFVTL